jgi:NADPH-dependent 2,4-dienoyl-CoA reductase/sulfur reductase-like enzyme
MTSGGLHHRREFLQRGSAALAAMAAGANVLGGQPEDGTAAPSPDVWSALARNVPVLAEYDVVVCGGGPAGCAAAIAPARVGARALLVEKYGYLGGRSSGVTCEDTGEVDRARADRNRGVLTVQNRRREDPRTRRSRLRDTT